jgi:hypothetical protein
MAVPVAVLVVGATVVGATVVGATVVGAAVVELARGSLRELDAAPGAEEVAEVPGSAGPIDSGAATVWKPSTPARPAMLLTTTIGPRLIWSGSGVERRCGCLLAVDVEPRDKTLRPDEAQYRGQRRSVAVG